MKTKLLTLFLAILASVGIASAAITVRLDPSSCSSWSTVRLRAWTAEGYLFNWPGITLVQDETGWYSYTFDENITSVNIIWHNGTDQTVDIESVTSSTCYALNRTTGTSITVSVVDCTYERVQIGNLYYNLYATSQTAEVTSQNNGSPYWSTNITTANIPASVTYGGTTYSVRSIGSSAFNRCSSLTSVTIPNSVTSIGWSAFSGCSSLTSITIPNSVTSIGEWAFEGCSSLTSVTLNSNAIVSKNYLYSSSIKNIKYIFGTQVTEYIIGDDVTSIGWNAFRGCTDLLSVTIPNSVTSIGGSAFEGCSGLTSVHISDVAAWCTISFEYKDFYANPLYYSHKLYLNGTLVTNLVIPNSVTSIGNYAFFGCSSLTSVEIPNSVTSIGEEAFEGCSSLTSVTIPNSVTSIGGSAFEECNSLTSVTLNSNAIASKNYLYYSNLKNMFGSQVTEYIIGDDVTSIGNYAFNGCSSLTSVEIPNSVTSIGEYAFAYCTGLTSVMIPNSVTSIGSGAFENCSSLTSVTLNSNAVASKNYLYYSTLKNIFGTQVTEYIIGDDVTSIGDYAFFDTNLTSVTIPNSVTSIGDWAFAVCSLFSITIPNSVTSIGDGAFWDCSGLTSVTIGNNVTSIGSGAFNYCTGLTSVTCYAITPPSMGDCAFCNVDCSQIPLYVPNESAVQYKVTDQWKNFDVKPLNPFNCTVNASASHGIVEGAGEYEGYSNVILKVIPENGYIFKQWSDGNTDNPRTIIIERDTMLTAICEEYQEPANTDLPYNEPFTSNIGRFSISDVNADGLSYVWKWASANYGMKASAYVSNTSHATESWLISPPISLKNASNIVFSFQHAVNKGTPTNLSVKISTNQGMTWSKLPVSNWPAGSDWTFVSASESLDAYANNTVQIAFVYVSTTSDCPTWEIKNFSITGTISVDPGEPMPITVDANETTAAVTWLEVPNAATYELIIYDSNWNVICVIVFNSEGYLLNITSYAPARDKSSQQEQTGGFAYTISELNSGTEYNYMLVAKDNTDKMVTSYSGSFKTTGSATALEEVDDHLLQSNPTQCTKVLRNGQIFILRGDKTYTLQGQEVK